MRRAPPHSRQRRRPRARAYSRAYYWRGIVVLLLLSAAMAALVARALHLQYYQQGMLQSEADQRQLRVVEIPARRGRIFDRNGAQLAVSTPVHAAWIDPADFDAANTRAVAGALEVPHRRLRKRLAAAAGRRFVYVKRHVTPDAAERLRRLRLDGVHLKREYRRYYPSGEVSAHVVGVTDVDGVGIEGVEKAYDEMLHAEPGAKRVLRDRRDRRVRDLGLIEAPRYGRDLELSFDQRIQYHAYRALKEAMEKHAAKAGSVVVLDARSGEILAAVNQPSFNPNERRGYHPGERRNRAFIDVFEPGSTIKPFIIAALLDGGYAGPRTTIETSPGYYRISRDKTIKDVRDYGRLDLGGILIKSSNVGVSKAVKLISEQELWGTLDKLGFGHVPGTGFPGEARGRLRYYREWHKIDHIVMAYGYGASLSPLQLAHMYTALANDGWRPTLSLLKGNPYLDKRQVFKPRTARMVRAMLRRVVSDEGTGRLAKVRGYTAAGKTGTTRKRAADLGEDNEYFSLFAGFAPSREPRLVAVVLIDAPSRGGYFGGQVAAPVFSRVMFESLRLMNVAADEQPGDGAGAGAAGAVM